MNSKCPICQEDVCNGKDTVVLQEKGSASINKAGEERKDSINVVPGSVVHKSCRQQYVNKKQIALHLKKLEKDAAQSSEPPRSLRSAEQHFDIKQHCVFCGSPAKYDGKKKGFDVIPVKTMTFHHSIKEICERRQDKWAKTVLARVMSVHCLRAADAVYHQDCSTNFRTGKQIPLAFSPEDSNPSKRKCGRPQDKDRDQAFQDVLKYLERNDEEQITITDLIELMKQKLEENGNPETDPYSFPHMKKKLEEYFGNRIIITSINGKPNVVTFYSTASTTLQQFYSQSRSDDAEEDKLRLVETAAKIIKNDIKSLATSSESYPDISSLSSVDEAVCALPESLKIFLSGVLTGKDVSAKLASLGQALMQAARPRVLTLPLQLGLAVQMHHHFGSRFLNDTLNKMGFASSYDEVKKFECSAAVSHGLDVPNFGPGHFIQYSADNVDHNIRTLDGLNTFHGMGMIAAVTPEVKQRKIVPKIKVSAEDIAATGRVKIHFYNMRPTMSRIIYKSLPCEHTNSDMTELDIIHHCSLLFKSPRPSWSGVMQAVDHGVYPGKSSTLFLPMIDMDPSDMSCIYSTLKFICAQAHKLQVTPVITFDQPLWFKALMIVENESGDSDIKNIVLRLGGLHTEMSFLGSIGNIMAGSGLQEVLEVIYAENAVQHILSGKAISRAVRAHLLVDSVLNALLISASMQTEDQLPEDPQPNELAQDSNDEKNLLSEVSKLYDELMIGTVTVQEASTAECVQKVQEQLCRQKQTLRNQKTATLWLLYLEMVTILKKFIRAERTGNWKLHLEALREMLPFLAASGHNLYTKSVRLYLQKMSELGITHPEIQQQFENGHHVVRRSDRSWAGLSTDLVIEQVLMRSLKTTGGLTHGRGMSEKQRLVWLLSMPTCIEVNYAMQDFSQVKYVTSDQHKDLGKSRQIRDTNDSEKIAAFFEARNPFNTDDSSLRNIATGVTASAGVNVCEAKRIGQGILNSMTDKSVDEFVFKKKDQVVTMSASSPVTIEQESVQIDPQLLFQRLLTVARATEENLVETFQHELCCIPPSLFESNGLLRPANKPVLADALWKLLDQDGEQRPDGDINFVIDGGALLQRIPWVRNQSYKSLCDTYVDHVMRNFGSGAIIVFDGYPDKPTTKDQAHLRRSKGMVGATINFTEDMIFNAKKELFLANNTNKTRFIQLLSRQLQVAGCMTYHAEEDADVLIASVAIKSSKTVPTIVIADDTDILVLLIHHSVTPSKGLFLQNTGRKTSKKRGSLWNIEETCKVLGDVRNHILFAHAVLGCDTTSAIFGIGKANALKKLKQVEFRQNAATFSGISTQSQIEKAGEAVLSSLYGGTDGKLNRLRYQKFCEKVASSSVYVEPKSLLPTSSAAKFHSYRVYLQVQQWMGNKLLDPCDWGWQISGEKLAPVMVDMKAAPDTLLKIIRCSCKSDCKTKRCTCRKYGLSCSNVCTGCSGINCTNAREIDLDDPDE